MGEKEEMELMPELDKKFEDVMKSNIKIAEQIAMQLNIAPVKHFIVKDLGGIVRKETKVVIDENTIKKNEAGENTYDTKEVIEDVESKFHRYLIIAVPTHLPQSNLPEYSVGDVVVCNSAYAKLLDYVKYGDTFPYLIEAYDIMGPVLSKKNDFYLQEMKEHSKRLTNDIQENSTKG